MLSVPVTDSGTSNASSITDYSELQPLLGRPRRVGAGPPAAAPLTQSVIGYYCAQIFNRKNALNLTAVTAITAATSLLMISTPFLFAKSFQPGAIDFLGVPLTRLQAVACFTSLLFLSKLLPIVRRMVVYPVTSRVTYNSLYNYDQKDLKQSHSYQLRTPLGKKQDEMVTTIMSSAELTNLSLNNIFPSICEMGAALGMVSSFYGWPTGVWVGGTTLASATFSILTVGFIRRAFTNYKLDRMNHYRYIASLWTNFESIYYFNTLSYELGKIRQTIDRTLGSDTNNFQVQDRINLLNNIIAQGSLMGVILYNSQNMIDGTLAPLDFSVLIYFILQMGITLNTLGESFSKISANYLDLKPIVNFIGNQPANPVNTPLLIPDDRAEIVFDNVNFSYVDEKGDSFKLTDISFKAKAGETVALVGVSTAGKSTIARLLFRLYDPESGNILINDQNIQDVDISSLRNQLGIVPQNPVLFNETIRYNVAYGALSTMDENVPDELIWDALEKVGLANDIKSWDRGLDTMVGQAGLRLSGGQLHRIAIARAIIRNAPIIVLDEHTSDLDSHTEEFVHNNLAQLLERKLKIVIAHRLPTIQRADKILVLDNGMVREAGTFDELMDKNGLFKSFWDKQVQKVLGKADEMEAIPIGGVVPKDKY